MIRNLVRYLKDTKDMATRFRMMDGAIDTIDVYVDSDWAGELADRRSTSSGALVINGCLMHSFSRTQTVVATSSAEAEFYARGSGLSEALLLQTVMREMGFECAINIHSDSKAACAMSTRSGLGKAKHIETKYLWQQEIFEARNARMYKINTLENPGDLGTKPLAATVIKKMCRILDMGISTRPVANDIKKTVGAIRRVQMAAGILSYMIWPCNCEETEQIETTDTRSLWPLVLTVFTVMLTFFAMIGGISALMKRFWLGVRVVFRCKNRDVSRQVADLNEKINSLTTQLAEATMEIVD
jgi:hypothetical protein